MLPSQWCGRAVGVPASRGRVVYACVDFAMFLRASMCLFFELAQFHGPAASRITIAEGSPPCVPVPILEPGCCTGVIPIPSLRNKFHHRQHNEPQQHMQTPGQQCPAVMCVRATFQQFFIRPGGVVRFAGSPRCNSRTRSSTSRRSRSGRR